MTGRDIAIDRNPKGAMGAYLASPDSEAKGGIVLVQEVFGVTRAIRDIADDLAANGYLVLAPDLFSRLEPGVQLGNGEDPQLRSKAIELLGRFDVETGVEDLCAAADHLRGLLPRQKRVAIAGFCIGGRMAALVAATGKVDAAVSFYGVGLERYIDRLRSISIPTAFYIGDQDSHIPPATIELLRDIIAKSVNSDLVLTLHPGAGHAFYNSHRKDMFNPAVAGTARTDLLSFLRRHLG